MIYEKMTAETWDRTRHLPECPNKGAFEVAFAGHTYFVVDGELHREDGPAMIYADGTQRYYYLGETHRKDGPAVVYSDGTQYYLQHGNLHRTDGPAMIYYDGSKSYYLFGKGYSKEDWEPLALQLNLKEQIA